MSQLPSSVQRNIKSAIERTLCREHREHPKVTFTSKGFNVSCCCEKFRSETIKKCEDAIGQALHEHIMNAFKGLK